MSRTKTVIKNAIWELGYYLIVILIGFLAPRYIILVYGSEVNGLSLTITQILNIILILQAGATTAAIFSLYKPIAENDINEISRNVYSAESFFKKISFVFAGIMLIAAVITSFFIKSSIDKIFIFISFVIMGFKSFLDLYFTSKFRIVFTAFQEKFIISIATLIEQIIYYALVFMTLYLQIHFVFLYLWLFVGCIIKVAYLEKQYKKKYGKLIKKCYDNKAGKIEGRGYALANEVSHSIVSSSVAIILSFMYGLQETSVYGVYSQVAQALMLVATALYSAFAPSFGNLIAADNKDNASRVFKIFQYMYVMLNSIMFYCLIVLITPFAKIYTTGAKDINYVNCLLACVLGISGIISAYRVPYNIVVSSCGFFKETWKQPVLCIIISLIVSVFAGMIDYSLILLGPTVFYLINFIYQHNCIKKLAPELISNNVFTMFVISILGCVLSSIACYKLLLPGNMASLLVYAVVTLMASLVFVVMSSFIFLNTEISEAMKYVRAHFLGGQKDA